MMLLDEQGARLTGRSTIDDRSAACAALLDRIATRQAVVGVIGLGYVGLPLAVGFADAGFRTVGFDIDARRVADLNAGRSHIPDVPAERIAALVGEGAPPAEPGRVRAEVLAELPGLLRNLTAADTALLAELPAPYHANGHGNGNGHTHHGHTPNGNGHAGNGHAVTVTGTTNGSGRARRPRRNGVAGPPAGAGGRFSATTDFDVLHAVDAVIVCVPTPLNRSKDPDMSYIEAATDAIARRMHPGMLVVLESTTYPGTTEELVQPRLEAAGCRPTDGDDARAADAGYTVGRDFFLAFSPERIDPGRTDYTVKTTPKVIGGTTPACLDVASALYGAAIDRVVPVSGTKTAEMVKLLENTFRAVNIGLVNELAIMCDHLGVDVWEVIEGAKTKPFGFMPFYPGPGLGGHCIPIDPLYLAWKLKTLDYNARFIQLASEINLGMPHHVLGKIADALNEAGQAIRGARVLLLGVAYKADISDMRESPALDLIRLLAEKGAQLAYHDPHVPYLKTPGLDAASVTLDQTALEDADCVVITTAHSSYDWDWIVQHSRVVVDTRNATRPVVATDGARVVRL